MTEESQSDLLGQVVYRMSPGLFTAYSRYRTLVNYIFAGGSAALVNLVTLYVLTDLFSIWYLASAVIAFLLAFSVSFYLQKHWTFQDHSTDGVQKQMTLYMMVSLANLFVNTLLMYFFVDIVGKSLVAGQPTWLVLLSQILTSAIIAVESFFVYRSFIFKGN